MREALDSARDPVDFFFRDDDAGWDDDGLWALLDLFTALGLPLDLAVIPHDLTRSLARGLLARAKETPKTLRFHQHGFAHVNHEPSGRKYEFGPSRAQWLQRRDIVTGRGRLRDLLGSVDPVFTPPWNRCTQGTGRCLAELGFRVLSREANAAPLAIPRLCELPINVDWFAHRKHVRLNRGELGELLARTAKVGRVGLMFHHAAMDQDELEATNDLLALVVHHSRARAHSMIELAGLGAPDLPTSTPSVTPGVRS